MSRQTLSTAVPRSKKMAQNIITLKCFQGCANNSLNYPPFKPHTFGGALAEKTICMDSKQVVKVATLQFEYLCNTHYSQHWSSHYDLHSMFGWSETEPTLRGVQTTTGKRGLVLSRYFCSSFPISFFLAPLAPTHVRKSVRFTFKFPSFQRLWLLYVKS